MGATLSVHQTISPLRIQEDIHQSQDQNATKGNLQAKERLPTTPFSYKNGRISGESKQFTSAWYIYLPKVQEYLILLLKML